MASENIEPVDIPLTDDAQTKEETAPKEDEPKKVNTSYGVLAGNMLPDLHSTGWDLIDPKKEATEDNLKQDVDSNNDPIFLGLTGAKAVTQPLPALAGHLLNDSAWQNQAGMSMEGLLLPCTIEFVPRNPKGVKYEHADTGYFPTFEQPNNGLMEWLHLGSDIDDATGLPKEFQGHDLPGVITAPTLNPFVAGHHVSTMLRGSTQQNLQIHKEGSSYGAPVIGRVPSELGQGQRPIGLRGPLIMTGWGYDTEDLPVPNAKLEAQEKDDDPRSATFGSAINLTDRAKKVNSKKIHFLNDHLMRVDQWRSGPVDLRWDRERKVWVANGRNRVYLCKTTKCIMPEAGPDGKNSWNWGVGGTTATPGRQYRNPCSDEECPYSAYFPSSVYYPDIEIHDPEDQEWCGKCRVIKVGANETPMVACDDFSNACAPFYDGIILKSVEHITSGKTTSDCGDKFRRSGAGPTDRRIGDPCHNWGSSYDGIEEYLGDLMDDGNNLKPTYSEAAASILHRKIFVENPLSQGLMLGDAFLSYDTGKRIPHTYRKNQDSQDCGVEGNSLLVTEMIPVHMILQAEFFGVEVVQSVACQQGEMGACTRKIFAQGMSTPTDCGPDDDYPSTAIY